MKVSENFDIREFVSQHTWNKWGANCIWFIRPQLFMLAQWYKDFFTAYYASSEEKEVDTVLVVINNWHYTSGKKFYWRGYRPPIAYYLDKILMRKPKSESLHRQGIAFDCHFIIKYKDGTRRVPGMAEIHKIIKDFWPQFKARGLTTIESLKWATTWLHSDMRPTGLQELLIVGDN